MSTRVRRASVRSRDVVRLDDLAKPERRDGTGRRVFGDGAREGNDGRQPGARKRPAARNR